MLIAEEIHIVEQTIKLLSTSDNWTTGIFCEGIGGEIVFPTSEKAKCWCAAGAVIKFSAAKFGIDSFDRKNPGWDKCDSLMEKIDVFCLEKCQLPLIALNDTLGREKVIEVLGEFLQNSPKELC